MKRNLLFGILFFATLFASCVVEERQQETTISTGPDVTMTFHAFNGDAPSSRTTLIDGTKVWWTPNDMFTLFFGTEAYAKLYSGLTEPAPVADFSGTIVGTPTPGAPVFAAYPLNVYWREPFREFDGEQVTLSLPAIQTAVAGGFADRMLPSIARSTTSDLYFYNVCGGIKFSVTREGVQSVTFRGNGGEPLAGTFKVGFGSDDRPVVSEVTAPETILTLVPDSTATFIVGKDYYFAALPAQLSSGYTMEFNTDYTKAVRVSTRNVTIKRAVWGEISQADKNLTYTVPAVPENEIWYKTSDGQAITIASWDPFVSGTAPESNTYADGQGVLRFSGPLTIIPDQAFHNKTTLREIHLPESVTEIGNDVFHGCSSLVGFYMPSRVTRIGYESFSSTGLRSVRLSPSLVTIGNRAFAETKLVEVHIPNSVTEVGEEDEMGGEWYESTAFSSPNLRRFTGKFASADGRCLIVCDTLKAFAYAGLTEYTLPAGIKCLISGMGLTSVASLQLNAELETIGRNCFSYGPFTGNVVLPNLKWIGYRAFRMCTRITSFYVPESLVYCGEQAFEGNRSLERFTGHHISADGRCLILNGELAATAMSGLTDYVIPAEVTVVRNGSFNNFYNNAANCPLTSLEFHAGVTHIGNAGFDNCRNLTRIVMKSVVPPVLDAGFGSYVQEIVVPAGSEEAYKVAPVWKNHAGIIVAESVPTR